MLSLILFLGAILIWLYIRRNDRALHLQPPDAFEAFSPHRLGPKDVMTSVEDLDRLSKLTVADQLPPRTGRKYIVAGFLGGWIVVQLLERGEDPKRIRVLDIKPPKRNDLTSGPAADVDFIQLDVSDGQSVKAAFEKPWPNMDDSEITVFHTASNIRFYERHPALLFRSSTVNVQGTQNVIDSAKAIGASVLVYTSSGSVSLRRSRFWLWPWEKSPPFQVQVINDDEDNPVLPRRHDEFFSNYAVSKMEAEKLVRQSDKTETSRPGTILRTGCLRPGNGIFGPGGDMLLGATLVRKTNPTWIQNILQSFNYVENCSLAHLCYERQLVDLINGTENPDIGGQFFHIADPGPPATYGDVYSTLSLLTYGETYFPTLSPTFMLLFAHLIEAYYVTQSLLSLSNTPILRYLGNTLPPINGDLINLQPSLWALTQVHLIFDDSRARLPPKDGGLGYRGAWTTVEALYKTVEQFKHGVSKFDNRSDMGGISLGWAMGRAQRGVGKLNDKVAGTMKTA
ncbi:hypothetical protein ONZ45_g18452 [Pleurotus djamor]|nr:hypothetical protein ONZ45_g18452 [Pleurotus djamor]